MDMDTNLKKPALQHMLDEQEVLTPDMLRYAIKVLYINRCGQTAEHTIVPLDVYIGKTEHYPQEQWLLLAWDVESNTKSIYALKDIKKWFTTPDEEEEMFF